MEADEPSTQNESEKSRFIRLGVYFILYGILLELSLLVARYQRHNDSHDENHGFLMVLVGIGALSMDLWYILANRDQLFDTKWDKLKLWFIVGVTVFFIIQIGKF